MKYWTQEQAPSTNFFDSLGTNDLASARSFAEHIRSVDGHKARVISRVDTVVEDENGKLVEAVELRSALEECVELLRQRGMEKERRYIINSMGGRTKVLGPTPYAKALALLEKEVP